MSSERIVICMKSYLGDAVMTIPLIQSLLQRYPEVHILTSKGAGEILQLIPGVRILPTNHRRGRNQLDLLRGGNYDVALLVNRSFRSAWHTRLAKIPRRIGQPTEARGFLLTDRIPVVENEFEATYALHLAEPLGVPTSAAQPTLRLPKNLRERGKELVGERAVGLQPGARYPLKQIPLSVNAEIANRLADQGFRIVLIGGREERADAERFQTMLHKPALSLVGKTMIPETLGCLSALTMMVGSDTGVMHMAAAVDCPTVTVFGPLPAERWGHSYGPHRVLSAPNKDTRLITTDALWAEVSSCVASIKGGCLL